MLILQEERQRNPAETNSERSAHSLKVWTEAQKNEKNASLLFPFSNLVMVSVLGTSGTLCTQHQTSLSS